MWRPTPPPVATHGRLCHAREIHVRHDLVVDQRIDLVPAATLNITIGLDGCRDFIDRTLDDDIGTILCVRQTDVHSQQEDGAAWRPNPDQEHPQAHI